MKKLLSEFVAIAAVTCELLVLFVLILIWG